MPFQYAYFVRPRRLQLRPNLSRSDEELRAKFAVLSSPRDLAELLEVPYSVLVFHLITNKGNNYKQFEIPKRTGGSRIILSPCKSLKLLQRKLSYILNLVHSPRPSAYGFIKDRNIIGNAQQHAKRRVVLNLDLQDFFPSINFGRVRGVFLKPPFKLPASVATCIAQACCHDGKLPQGAPTSPIISNMVCRRLDGQLQMFASKRKCVYTRYADDITISTNQKQFSGSIVKEVLSEEKNVLELGEELVSIIRTDNKFEINYKKLRLRRSSQRQEVTGLIVNNEDPNIRRSLIRQVRAMFHAWDKFGLTNAADEHFSKYKRTRLASVKYSTPEKRSLMFKRILFGKLMFIKQVRGATYEPYQRFVRLFKRLDPDFVLPPLPDPREQVVSPLADRIKEYLWVISPKDGTDNGTAFMLDKVGLITNAHCVFNDCVAYRAHKISEHAKPYTLRVEWKHEHLDLAILRFSDEEVADKIGYQGLRPRLGHLLKQGEEIFVCGFPTFSAGDHSAISHGQVMSKKTRLGTQRYIVSARIDSGMSGCPMLNKSLEVLGIAATGSQLRRETKSVNAIKDAIGNSIESDSDNPIEQEIIRKIKDNLLPNLIDDLAKVFELKRSGEHPDHAYEHGVIPINILLQYMPEHLRPAYAKDFA